MIHDMDSWLRNDYLNYLRLRIPDFVANCKDIIMELDKDWSRFGDPT